MADPRPGSLDPKIAEMIVAEIKRQPITGKSSRTVAHEFGVHYQTIANYRRRLERQGLIDRLPRGGTRLRREGLLGVLSESNLELKLGAPGDASATMLTAQFLANLDKLDVLTPEQIIKRLTWLSVAPEVPFPTQVVASKALYEIQEAERSRASLQRDVPKTREQALAHLKIMRSCVGAVMWEEAGAFVTLEEETWKVRSPATTSTSAPLTTTSPSPTGGGSTSPDPSIDATVIATATAVEDTNATT